MHRQPFPGPGLAIRIIGEVTPEKLEILKNADAIVREELDTYNEQLFEKSGERNGEVARENAGGPEVERSVWQYFAVLPDVRSVGVMGDERTYQHPIILRAVESSDAMTRRLGEAPLRCTRAHLEPYRCRSPRHQPRRLRHHIQTPCNDRVGVKCVKPRGLETYSLGNFKVE